MFLDVWTLPLLMLGAAFAAGVRHVVADGGSFLTLPARRVRLSVIVTGLVMSLVFFTRDA